LDEYLTPIWIQVTNRGQADVRVTYADLSLTDATGFRYAAVSPYRRDDRQSVWSSGADGVEPESLSGADGLETDTSSASRRNSEWYFDSAGMRDEHAQLLPLDDNSGHFELARHTMHGGGGMRGGAIHGGGGMRGGAIRGGGAMRGGGVHGGFRHGGYYGPQSHFYGPAYGYGFYGYYSPWPYFYAWPPYYGPYVYYWSPRYYPAEPPESIRQRGLPEGILHPGGTVSGFVYFQHVEATRPTKLDLAWSVRDKDAKQVAVLHVPLAVVPE
jgi:hypothetical protein